MYRTLLTIVAGAAIAGLPVLTGCDRGDQPVKEQHSVEKKADGTTVQTDKKVTQDGKTVEKKVETGTNP